MMSRKQKWVKIDAWRGYNQPSFAVAGVSDTGTWSDSPCPSNRVHDEIKMAQAALRSHGIHTRITTARSSNVFMQKIWIIVSPQDMARAKRIVAGMRGTTQYLHGAD